MISCLLYILMKLLFPRSREVNQRVLFLDGAEKDPWVGAQNPEWAVVLEIEGNLNQLLLPKEEAWKLRSW